MADDQQPTITETATTAAPAVDAAITPNPTASPAVETATVPATDTAVEKSADAAASAIGNPEPAKAETPTPPVTESVLGDEKPKEEVKTEVQPETKAEEVKVELPAYEPFTLPENVSLDKEPLDAFTKILGEIETGKLDHVGMQGAGQKLIDLAAKSTIESINRLNDHYVGIHEKQKSDWFEAFKKDPEMGGEKLNETVGMLRESVDTYGGDKNQISEFRQLMKETGVGNHPAVTRLLYNMQKKIDSYTKEDGNRSVQATAPAPSRPKAYNSFYAGNNG